MPNVYFNNGIATLDPAIPPPGNVTFTVLTRLPHFAGGTNPASNVTVAADNVCVGSDTVKVQLFCSNIITNAEFEVTFMVVKDPARTAGGIVTLPPVVCQNTIIVTACNAS